MTSILPSPADLERRTDDNAVEVRGVEKAFGDFKVLQGLDLDFKRNSITTVLGPSGTGKSVLLKHMVALLEPEPLKSHRRIDTMRALLST